MNVLQKMDSDLADALRRSGLPYALPDGALRERVQGAVQPEYCYAHAGCVLLSDVSLEERLAERYCVLTQKYAPEQECVFFDPAILAQSGPWKKAHVEYALPTALCVNFNKGGSAFLEAIESGQTSLDEIKQPIALPDAEVHALAMLHTDYYGGASVAPTDFCNLKCKMCFYHTEDVASEIVRYAEDRLPDKKRYLAGEDVVFAYIDQISAGKSIMFGGCGEYFTHKNWRSFMAYAFGRGLVGQVLTNGLLLNRKNTDFCLEHGLRGAIFSIDGYDKRSYENIRIGGVFETALANLAYMYGRGKAYVRVNSVMLPEVRDKKDAIKKLFVDKAHAVSFHTVKIDEYANTEKPVRKYGGPGLCYELLGGIILMPDGRYAPCCGILNATFCLEFPWLLDSRTTSFAKARNIYAAMLFDERSPLSRFCGKCNLKWQSYYYNGEHAFEEFVPLNPFSPSS